MVFLDQLDRRSCSSRREEARFGHKNQATKFQGANVDERVRENWQLCSTVVRFIGLASMGSNLGESINQTNK